MLKNIQALRALAALSVLSYHLSLLHASALPVHCGAFGVDLFFVVSGFIIAYSADRDARHFLVHRLIRVLPPYWIATFAGFLLLLPRGSARETVIWFARSLVFVPGPGGRSTIIFVAWTLVYELAFYFLYALSLQVTRRFAPAVCLPVLLVLAYGVNHGGMSFGPWPLLVEFAFGLAIFMLHKQVSTGRPWPTGPALILVGVGLVLLFALDGQGGAGGADSSHLRRVIMWGVPAALLVLGVLLLEWRGLFIASRFILLLGNASYAMYLLHPLLMSLLAPLPSGSRVTRTAWFCFGAFATIVCALLYYAFVEAPTIRWLRGRLSEARAPLVSLPAG